MNSFLNILLFSSILIFGILILKFTQKIFYANKYQKIIKYIPLIKLIYSFLMLSYFIVVHLFNSIVIGLFITTLIFVLIKNNIENIYYGCIFKIREYTHNNFIYTYKEKQGTVKTTDLINLTIESNNITYTIPYKELFKNGYEKTESLKTKNNFSLRFKTIDGFKINDFEKFLFTLNSINFIYKPNINIDDNVIEIRFHENNIQNKNIIKQQILNHKYIDELEY